MTPFWKSWRRSSLDRLYAMVERDLRRARDPKERRERERFWTGALPLALAPIIGAEEALWERGGTPTRAPAPAAHAPDRQSGPRRRAVTREQALTPDAREWMAYQNMLRAQEFARWNGEPAQAREASDAAEDAAVEPT